MLVIITALILMALAFFPSPLGWACGAAAIVLFTAWIWKVARRLLSRYLSMDDFSR